MNRRLSLLEGIGPRLRLTVDRLPVSPDDGIPNVFCVVHVALPCRERAAISGQVSSLFFALVPGVRRSLTRLRNIHADQVSVDQLAPIPPLNSHDADRDEVRDQW